MAYRSVFGVCDGDFSAAEDEATLSIPPIPSCCHFDGDLRGKNETSVLHYADNCPCGISQNTYIIFITKGWP